MTEQCLHLFHEKKKRQGWSNYKILTQFHIAKGQERLDGNTVDVVFKNPLAGGSQQGFTHCCKWAVPFKRINTVQGRRLQEDGLRPPQGNQPFILATATVSLVQARYLPQKVLNCALCFLGAQRGPELASPDCWLLHLWSGGSCKYKKTCVTISSLRDPVFGISDWASNMNGTFDLNLSVSTLCQHNAGKINSCLSSTFMNYIKNT